VRNEKFVCQSIWFERYSSAIAGSYELDGMIDAVNPFTAEEAQRRID
jgi:hypothetical protein